jgi:serine/threonine protein kinase
LLERLLDFDPTTRITVTQALEHEYLELYHDKDDEPTHTPMNFAFEQSESIEEMKKMILEEITTYPHPSQTSLQRKGCVPRAHSVAVGGTLTRACAHTRTHACTHAPLRGAGR